MTGAEDGATITIWTPKRGGGEATVDEDDLLAGSDTTKESLTTTGSFNISAPDGVANLSVHGVQLIDNGVFTPATIPTPLGNVLNITAYNAATGEIRSEEHTSELQSLMRISYAVFCLTKKNTTTYH